MSIKFQSFHWNSQPNYNEKALFTLSLQSIEFRIIERRQTPQFLLFIFTKLFAIW